MARWFGWLAMLAVLVTLPTPAPAQLSAHPAAWAIPSNAEIARLLDARIAGRAGEGIVVGIVTPSGRRIVARGPKGAPAFDGRTLFEIGSVTKVFTGLLLADMARRGEVRLDQPVNELLPADIGPLNCGKRPMQLVDLATHTSGLPRLPGHLVFADMDDPYAAYTAD